MAGHRVFRIPFADVFVLYQQKVERKGKSKAELLEVIAWLTGYDELGVQRAIDEGVDLERFYADAPAYTQHAELITGVICGIRVEEIEDPLMQRIRHLDKLVDELARGKKMSSILRAPAGE